MSKQDWLTRKEEDRSIQLSKMKALVGDYYDKFNKPIRYQIVRNHFGRVMEKFGGIDLAIEDLERSNIIYLDLAETGAKLIYPVSKKSKGKK